jgi:hypothetical protein
VAALVAEGASLDPFWLGKIAVDHAPLVEELLQRGLLQAPALHPHFLQRDDVRQRVGKLRESGTRFAAIIGD